MCVCVSTDAYFSTQHHAGSLALKLNDISDPYYLRVFKVPNFFIHRIYVRIFTAGIIGDPYPKAIMQLIHDSLYLDKFLQDDFKSQLKQTCA